jgi:hypothetical protein
MTAKVGLVEREGPVVARQGNDERVSTATDTDVTIQDGVVYASVRGNAAVDKFPQQRINSQQYTKRCFLCGPPRGHITRTSSRPVLIYK